MNIDYFDQISLLPYRHEYTDYRRWNWPILDPDTAYETVYVTREDIEYRFVGWIGEIKYWFKLFVSAEYRCDGRSTPPILWSRFRPDGPCRIAAHAHDAAYQSEGFRRKEVPVKLTCQLQPGMNGFPVTLSRKACDQIYLNFRTQTCPRERIKANLEYGILRIAGKKYYGSDMRPNGDMK